MNGKIFYQKIDKIINILKKFEFFRECYQLCKKKQVIYDENFIYF